MRIRSKLEGVILRAEIRPQPEDGQGRRLVIVGHLRQARQVPLGPLTAAIGYELFTATREERSALEQAGYHLADAGQTTNRLAPVVAVLRAAQLKRRIRRGVTPKEVMPRRVAGRNWHPLRSRSLSHRKNGNGRGKSPLPAGRAVKSVGA